MWARDVVEDPPIDQDFLLNRFNKFFLVYKPGPHYIFTGHKVQVDRNKILEYAVSFLKSVILEAINIRTMDNPFNRGNNSNVINRQKMMTEKLIETLLSNEITVKETWETLYVNHISDNLKLIKLHIYEMSIHFIVQNFHD